MGESTRFLVIHTDGEIEEGNEMLSEATVQRIVGGAFKSLATGGNGLVLSAEDGKALALPFNWLASTWLRPYLHPADTIVGDVIVAGMVDEGNEPTDISFEVEAMVREVKSHFIQRRGDRP